MLGECAQGIGPTNPQTNYGEYPSWIRQGTQLLGRPWCCAGGNLSNPVTKRKEKKKSGKQPSSRPSACPDYCFPGCSNSASPRPWKGRWSFDSLGKPGAPRSQGYRKIPDSKWCPEPLQCCQGRLRCSTQWTRTLRVCMCTSVKALDCQCSPSSCRAAWVRKGPRHPLDPQCQVPLTLS